ncbi:MAG: rhodanese-like domain-containing protein [Planctomycetes bacterium]|nr:rhodanese-like domain-containing protein [Planctomycetota bacterium]
MTRKRLVILAVVLAAAAGAAGGFAFRHTPPGGDGLAQVQAEVRARFPDVAHISTGELAAWLADGSRTTPLLLDARTREEFDVSHLPGAVFLPHDAGELSASDGRPVVVYCSVGYRSAMLARRLAEAGHADVRNLEGSIFKWANEGRALARAGAEGAGEVSASAVHPYNAEWGRLLLPELRSSF